MNHLEKIQEIMQAKSQAIDNEIRNLCRTYGFVMDLKNYFD